MFSVPQMFLHCENFTPCEICASGGGLLVTPIYVCFDHILHFISSGLLLVIDDHG